MNDPIVTITLAALRRLAPTEDGAEIVGDLAEEWAEFVLPERGAGAARTWLLRQAAASAPHLLVLRWRRGELQRALGIAGAGAAAAALAYAAGDAAWHRILTLVPLRASHAPSLPWIAAHLAFIVAAGFVAAAATARFLPSSRRVSS